MTSPTATITTSPESGATAAQTIAGSVAGPAVAPGQLVTLSDNGVDVGSAALTASDTFSAAITLASLGANSLTASLTDGSGNVGVSAPLVDTLTAAAVTGTAGSSGLMGDTGSNETDTVSSQTLSSPVFTASYAGGAGGSSLEDGAGFGGLASVTLTSDSLASTASDVLVAAAGGAGGASETQGPATGGSGGDGGSGTADVSGLTGIQSSPTTLTLASTGGSGGAGGSGGNSGVGGNGGNGAAANSTLDGSMLTGSAGLVVTLAAGGGAGGNGANGSTMVDEAGGAGTGGNATASLENDILQAATVGIGLTATGGAAGETGTGEHSPGGPALPPQPGTAGTGSVDLSGDSITVGGGAGVDLSLALGGTALSASTLTFSGNSFAGTGSSTLALSLGSGGYAIDTAADTIAIAGSPTNTLTGFDVFDMQGVSSGPNSFVVGGASVTLALGGGVTTVTLDPTSGSLTLEDATAANLVLNLSAFASISSLAQLNADTSTVGGNEVVSLPEGQTITIEGAPVSFSSSNVMFGSPAGVVAVGSGTSTLALTVSERGEPAGAQFTIDVDGTQVGGVQTTSADSTQGQLQTYDVLGSFANGANTVTINYLNASNSLLEVNSASLDNVPAVTNGLVLSNDGSASFGFTAMGAETPVAIGSGRDTLALFVAERGEPAGAQFTISVDGTQIGGTQTTSADLTAGQYQEFDVSGNFTPGAAAVSVNYINANESVLSVENATIDGSAIPNSAIVLSNDGAEGFGFTAPLSSAVPSIGSGPDVLALSVAQTNQPTGADFTVSVNGAQIGGVQTTTGTMASSAAPDLDVLGNFLPGQNTVSIDYLNASNSLLTVDAQAIDGTTPTPITLSNIGSQSFTFTEPAAATPGATVLGAGNGADTIAFAVSQAGQPSGADFTIDVDGTQVGGVQTTTADQSAGQSQVFNVDGTFAGSHTVSLNYLNASNSLLFVSGGSIDGAGIAGSSAVLSNIGSTSFTFNHTPTST